jgi:hypothetical protein
MDHPGVILTGYTRDVVSGADVVVCVTAKFAAVALSSEYYRTNSKYCDAAWRDVVYLCVHVCMPL